MVNLCLVVAVTVMMNSAGAPETKIVPIGVFPEKDGLMIVSVKKDSPPPMIDERTGNLVLSKTWDCVYIPEGKISAP